MKTYNEKLKKVAYLMPDQLIHIMELEGISVNLAVVANKKQYAKIYCQVNKGKSERYKDYGSLIFYIFFLHSITGTRKRSPQILGRYCRRMEGNTHQKNSG